MAADRSAATVATLSIRSFLHSYSSARSWRTLNPVVRRWRLTRRWSRAIPSPTAQAHCGPRALGLIQARRLLDPAPLELESVQLGGCGMQSKGGRNSQRACWAKAPTRPRPPVGRALLPPRPTAVCLIPVRLVRASVPRASSSCCYQRTTECCALQSSLDEERLRRAWTGTKQRSSLLQLAVAGHHRLCRTFRPHPCNPFSILTVAHA